jgi:hypothetical protein
MASQKITNDWINPLLGIFSKEMKSKSQRDVYTPVFIDHYSQ